MCRVQWEMCRSDLACVYASVIRHCYRYLNLKQMHLTSAPRKIGPRGRTLILSAPKANAGYCFFPRTDATSAGTSRRDLQQACPLPFPVLAADRKFQRLYSTAD